MPPTPAFVVATFSLIASLIADISSAQSSGRSAEISRWKAVQPEIEKCLSKEPIWNECPEAQRAISVTQAADVTGDGVPEAIVGYCHMGAYTSDAVVLRLVDGKPVIHA